MLIYTSIIICFPFTLCLKPLLVDSLSLSTFWEQKVWLILSAHIGNTVTSRWYWSSCCFGKVTWWRFPNLLLTIHKLHTDYMFEGFGIAVTLCHTIYLTQLTSCNCPTCYHEKYSFDNQESDKFTHICVVWIVHRWTPVIWSEPKAIHCALYSVDVIAGAVYSSLLTWLLSQLTVELVFFLLEWLSRCVWWRHTWL